MQKYRKPATLAAVLALILAVATACGSNATVEPGEKSAASPSSTAGVETHTFEGEGKADEYVDSEPVELHGQYTVKWEVTDNDIDGTKGNIHIKLEGGDGFHITADNVINGSGTKKIQADYPTKYNASVFTVPGAQWKLTLTRTCAGTPPDCPPLTKLPNKPPARPRRARIRHTKRSTAT